MAKTKPSPVCSRQSSAKSYTTTCSREKVIPGLPIIKAASEVFSIEATSGARVIHSGSNPKNSRKITRTSAADVREELSRATVRTSLKSLSSSFITSTTLLTRWREPDANVRHATVYEISRLEVCFINSWPVLQGFPGSATLQRGFWSRARARRSQGEGTGEGLTKWTSSLRLHGVCILKMGFPLDPYGESGV